MIEAYINIVIIFVLIFMGYCLTWKKWFDNKVADAMAKLVLNITLPVGMFLNITKEFTKEEFLEICVNMLLPLTFVWLYYLVSWVAAKIVKVEEGKVGLFRLMWTTSNTIFMGMPVSIAIFGESAVPYVLMYYICNTSFFWTLGVYGLSKDNQDMRDIKFGWKEALKKIFSPALLGFIIGLVCVLLNFRMPASVNQLFNYLGGMTTPLSMMVIGTIIFQTKIKNLHMSKEIFAVLIGRYVAAPILLWALSRVIPVPEQMLRVFIIQAAMPVQSSTPILARSYNVDETFATAGLSYSVLLYLGVIPILLYFIFA